MEIQFPESIHGLSFVEYLTIFVSLIFAVGVADFLLSNGKLIHAKQRVTMYWELGAWSFVHVCAMLTMI